MKKFIYYTGTIIGFSTAASAGVISLLLFLPLDGLLLTIVWLLTVGSYTMDRVLGLRGDACDHPERCRYISEHRCAFLLFSASTIVCGFLASFFHSLNTGILSLLVPFFVFIYTKSWGGRGRSFKKIPFLKDFFIAGVWTAKIVFVLVYFDVPSPAGAVLLAVGLFGKFYVMTALYDFKDIVSDRQNGIMTLPNSLGEEKTRRVLHAVNLVSTTWMLGILGLGVVSAYAMLFLPAFVYQIYLIQKVSHRAPMWIFYGLCDMEQVVWLSAALVMRALGAV
jgi:4-hydroxybenzoate polyprenyltransferase